MFAASDKLCRFALPSITNCSSRRKPAPHAQAEGVGLSRVLDNGCVAQYVQSHVADDFSLIQLFDRTRGLRIFFDARDHDSVLGYWCTETPNCVWNVLETDGELRHGADVDCTHVREFDHDRHFASTTIRAVDPVLRVPSDGRSAQDIALVTAGTPNLVSVSDLSAELNSRSHWLMVTLFTNITINGSKTYSNLE